MGDVSTEPSMEEILSSIKRIIAEEGEGGQPRQRRPLRSATPAPAVSSGDGSEEVLELSDPIPVRGAEPKPATSPRSDPQSVPVAAAPRPAASPPPALPAAQENDEPIVSERTAAASRGSLEALSKLRVKPDADSDGTIEGMVREMLRPMLRDWLDANLPDLVEAMVAREIEKITSQPG